MSETIRLATRGSLLAMWQARHVRALLLEAWPGLSVEVVPVQTTGDRDRATPLAGAGGVGLFTKEIEQALLDDRADVAVHSLKDLPTAIPPGLVLGAVPRREDPRDALVGRPGRVGGTGDLRPGVVVGTGSPRRRGQLLATFPGIEVRDLRGNVPTRVDSVMREDGPHAVVLALAGLRRLGLEDRVTAVLPPETMLPAPGQGALGVEVREDDERASGLVAALDHAPTRAAVLAERAFLRRLEGGCTVPAGALGTVGADGALALVGVVADPEGGVCFRESLTGDAGSPEAAGRELADRLAEGGARAVLARFREERR